MNHVLLEKHKIKAEPRRHIPEHRLEHWMVLLFILLISLGGFLYLVWPRDEVSEIEKRQLARFPELKLQNWFTGELQSDIDRFYADQLPLREPLMRLDQQVDHNAATLFGLRRTQLIEGGDLVLGEGENVGFDEEDLIEIPTTSSAAVTSTAASEPSVTSSTESSTSATSTEAQTSASSETSTEPTVTTAEPVIDRNLGAVLVIDDQALEAFGYLSGYVDRYSEELNRLQAVSGPAVVYSLVAPTANEFYSPMAYHSGSASQKNMIAELDAALSPEIRRVDAYTPLSQHTDEYLWFRTDHHWTARGAYYAYTAFCQAAGLTPVPLESMEHGTVSGDFLGSLYRYSGQLPQLAAHPDQVEYWLPPITSEGYTFTDESMTAGWAIELIAVDYEGGNQYMAFTQGDHGLARFTTDVGNGRTLLVIKESYGNAMVPFLASHYETVYIIDPRRIELSLEAFIANQGVDDVLVVNYASALGNPSWNDGFRALLGLPD